MSGTKIVVIILVVIALLFVVLVIRGAHKNSSETTTGDSKNDANTFQNGNHPGMATLNKLLSPHAPKLKLEKATFDLGLLPAGGQLHITAPPDEKHPYRKATFYLSKGNLDCGQIEYKTADGSGEEQHLNDQVWPPDSPPPNTDPRQVNFTIVKAGGPITFTHNFPMGPCVIDLQ